MTFRKTVFNGSWRRFPFPNWDDEIWDEETLLKYKRAMITHAQDPIELLDTPLYSNSIAGVGKSNGGVLAPNGFIYMHPNWHNRWIKIDPENLTMTPVGPDYGGATSKFRGCFLGHTGKLYAVGSRNGFNVSVLDPEDDSVYNFGSLSGNGKFVGAVMSPQGFGYTVPFSYPHIVKIDIEEETLELIGNIPGLSKFRGAVLADNGKIYFVPDSSNQVMVLNPETDEISFFGSGLGGRRFESGCLAPNGKIYCSNAAGTNILVIDPETETTYFIPNSVPCIGFCLYNDGKLYTAPFNSNFMVILDPETETVEHKFIPGLDTTFNAYYDVKVAFDGCMYGIPFSAGRVIRLSKPAEYVDQNDLLSRIRNRA